MKKLLRPLKKLLVLFVPLKKLNSFFGTPTGTTAVTAIAFFILFQLAVINAIVHDWNDLFWVAIVAVFLLTTVSLRKRYNEVFGMLQRQNEIDTQLIELLHKADHKIKSQEATISKNGKTISKQGTLLGELRSELAKYNGQENKQSNDTENDSEPGAGSSTSAAGE